MVTLPAFAFAGSQNFTSSGTFTVPSYGTLTVTVNGAGGRAGGASGVTADPVGKTCGYSNTPSGSSGGTGGGCSVGDCDNDGYTVAEGDCCDQSGGCSTTPELRTVSRSVRTVSAAAVQSPIFAGTMARH